MTSRVEGSVFGVVLRGRAPASFRAYLHPLPPAPGEGAGPEPLRLTHRRVERLPEVAEIWSVEAEALPGRTPGRFALFAVDGGFGLAVDDAGRGQLRFSPGAVDIAWWSEGTGAEHYLFTYGLPLWLETRGVPVLHGSAVVVEGRAVGFLGPSGTGKSVLAAELRELGCGFLADDGLALRGDPGGWRCAPGPPIVRLWPSGLERRPGVRAEELPRVHRGIEKRRLALAPPGSDAPLATGPPVAALYLLERRDPGVSVEVAELAPREGLVALLEHGVAAAPAAALGHARERLDRLAALAESVPVRRLAFPGGADSAPRVLEAIAG